MGKVKEIIICPECNTIQEATVKQSIPFWVYIHDCINCGYTIMESDWEKIVDTKQNI